MGVIAFEMSRKIGCAALTTLALTMASSTGDAAGLDLNPAGELRIDGRSVSCKSDVRTVLDVRLPNLGIATRRLLVLNPHLLGRQSPTVRLFVYHHECGHHHVGGDEMGADCWAVRTGVADGWLRAPQLNEICTSFGNAGATATHPAARARCQALRVCFAEALKAPPAGLPTRDRPEVAQQEPAPQPNLVREGFSAPLNQRAN